MRFTVPECSMPPARPDDPRLGHLLGTGVVQLETGRVVLLGFPSDEGVRRNGGRTGAARAPDAIRQALFRLTPDARRYDAVTDLLAHTVDLGNLAADGTMETHQEHLGRVLAPYLERGAVPIILGGGHETAYGHFLGYVGAGRSVAILNWDAHADVRPLLDGQGHSGSPFRQALEHPSGCCRGYTAAGLLPHSTARAHLDFLHAAGGRYFWRDDLTPALVDTLYESEEAPLLVTFDVDAVDQSQAPGVSAPAVGGVAAELWFQAAEAAGRCPAVTSIDLVEVNPACDAGSRTARLAALTVWHVLHGLAERMNEC